MKLVFFTSSKTKFSIARDILNDYGIMLTKRKFNFDEIQDIDVKKVALNKSNQVERGYNGPFIIEDSGLYIESLNNFPGALLKFVYLHLGAEKIPLMVANKGRFAVFINVLVLRMPESKPIIFTTETRGKIARVASGGRKMGWAIEQFFIPSGFDKTLAQLDDSEYNSFWQDFKKSLHYSQLGAYLSPVHNHKRA